ncbi:MAG: mechanosensitive ion channel domain-containing protein, partial [Nevskiales bacterium]
DRLESTIAYTAGRPVVLENAILIPRMRMGELEVRNITAYVVLLLHKSYRRGNFVRVIDFDNYIEGYIAEVNVFNTRLITEAREVIIYPNNLLISRPTIINPRSRLQGVGKITEVKQAGAEPGSTANPDE